MRRRSTRWVVLLAVGLLGLASWAAGKELTNGMDCTFSSDCASGNCSFKTCKAK